MCSFLYRVAKKQTQSIQPNLRFASFFIPNSVGLTWNYPYIFCVTHTGSDKEILFPLDRETFQKYHKIYLTISSNAIFW